MTDKELALELFNRLNLETSSSSDPASCWTMREYCWESAQLQTEYDNCELMFTFENDGSFRGDGYELYDIPTSTATEEAIVKWMEEANSEELLWLIRQATEYLSDKIHY